VHINSCIGNIARNKESATVLKLEWWGSPLVRGEKHHEKPQWLEEEEEKMVVVMIKVKGKIVPVIN
jgi:hypothetical protein